MYFTGLKLFFSRLAKKLKDSKQSKEGLAQEIKNKQEYLENLQPKLKTVLEVCMHYHCMCFNILIVLRSSRIENLLIKSPVKKAGSLISIDLCFVKTHIRLDKTLLLKHGHYLPPFFTI